MLCVEDHLVIAVKVLPCIGKSATSLHGPSVEVRPPITTGFRPTVSASIILLYFSSDHLGGA